jgi:hypothetical protein
MVQGPFKSSWFEQRKPRSAKNYTCASERLRINTTTAKGHSARVVYNTSATRNIHYPRTTTAIGLSTSNYAEMLSSSSSRGALRSTSYVRFHRQKRPPWGAEWRMAHRERERVMEGTLVFHKNSLTLARVEDFVSFQVALSLSFTHLISLLHPKVTIVLKTCCVRIQGPRVLILQFNTSKANP